MDSVAEWRQQSKEHKFECRLAKYFQSKKQRKKLLEKKKKKTEPWDSIR